MGGAADLPGFDKQQLKKAARSLLKYVGEQQQSGPAQLLDDDELLHLVIALKKAPTGPRKDKPIRLLLPHPLWAGAAAAASDAVDAPAAPQQRAPEVCLFVKDHKGEGHKAAKARLAKFERRGGVAKVIGLSKLRTKYESHEAKRALCGAYDLFLADERILPSLPKLIGKSFFKKKKQPIPVDIRATDFPAQVKAALASTYMVPPTGTCVSIRVARSSMAADAVAANALAALRAAVQHVPKKWANVQAVYLKTTESVALPVYQVLPDAPTKIAAGAAAADAAAAVQAAA